MSTFTDAQIADICEILEKNSDEVGARLTAYADIITADDKTKALALITSWQTLNAANDGVSFVPTESNKGFKSDTDDKMGKLARRLAALLYLDELAMPDNRLIRS